MATTAKRPISGSVGWTVLTAYVLVWDLHPSTETLSHAFAASDRKYRHGHPFSILAWLVLTLHLARVLPDHVDPIRRLAARCPVKKVH